MRRTSKLHDQQLTEVTRSEAWRWHLSFPDWQTEHLVPHTPRLKNEKSKFKRENCTCLCFHRTQGSYEIANMQASLPGRLSSLLMPASNFLPNPLYPSSSALCTVASNQPRAGLSLYHSQGRHLCPQGCNQIRPYQLLMSSRVQVWKHSKLLGHKASTHELLPHLTW